MSALPRAVLLKRGLAIAAVLVLVLAVVLVVQLGKDATPDTSGSGRAGGLPSDALDSVVPTVNPSAAPASGAKGRVVTLPNGRTLTFAAQGGAGFVITPAKRYTLTLTARSSQAIGTLGYLIPTSDDSSRGVIKNVGTSWSLTTTVTGRPNYAVLFVQAGASGAPISCSVRIDGRVADARSTSGAYGRQVCYA